MKNKTPNTPQKEYIEFQLRREIETNDKIEEESEVKPKRSKKVRKTTD